MGLRKVIDEEKVTGRVVLVGAKYGKDAHKYFLESDIFVYPSGIGLSILHALSVGLPVLTTDKINLHFPEFELLVKDENGDLFVNDSPEDIASKIIEWSKNLSIDRNKYKENCLNIIKEKEYLPECMTSKVIDFLKLKLVENN